MIRSLKLFVIGLAGIQGLSQLPRAPNVSVQDDQKDNCKQ